jgi:hypothetical protein
MVVLPEVSDNDDDLHCDLVTDSYTLTVEGGGGGTVATPSGCNDAACILVFFAVPLGSLVVSGSIVAVGNTVHWIEKQGRCDDSHTRRAVATLVSSSKAAGGHVLTTAGDAINWLRSNAHLGKHAGTAATTSAPEQQAAPAVNPAPAPASRK